MPKPHYKYGHTCAHMRQICMDMRGLCASARIAMRWLRPLEVHTERIHELGKHIEYVSDVCHIMVAQIEPTSNVPIKLPCVELRARYAPDMHQP